jgi:hypothetical protein
MRRCKRARPRVRARCLGLEYATGAPRRARRAGYVTQCTALLYRLRSLRRAVRAAGPPWRACRRGIGLLASLGDRVDVPHLSESRGRSVSQGVRRASDVFSNTCTPLLCATRVQPILHTASLFHAREQAPARDQRGVDGPDAAGGAQLDNGARGGGRCGGHVRGFLVRPGRCGTERVGQAAPSPPPTASDARPTPPRHGRLRRRRQYFSKSTIFR